MNYIGIDLGTSGVKIIVMNASGEIVTTTTKTYPVEYPNPGWSEQNPQDWFARTLEGLEEVLEKVPSEEIRGVSFGGQMHGLVVLDEKDQVIRPAILWNDGRSIKQCQQLNEGLGKETLIQYTQNIAFPGFTAPKILWMKENEPEFFARIKKIMLPKDYLIYCLTGVFATDVSDASGTLLFNVSERIWSKEMLGFCDIKINQLPKVFESYERVGKILPKWQKRLRLRENVVVAAGAGDNAAAAVGTGTTGNGACNISVGTSGTIFIASDAMPRVDNPAIHSFAHSDGNYHLLGCMLSAASSYDWWTKTILGIQDYNEAQENIVLEEKNDVFFLPYLMGERSPHNNPKVRGAFVGMSLDTTRADMVRSVMEGVAFGMKDSLEIARDSGMVIESSTISGGGSQSGLWRRILASVLNVKLEVPEAEEGPAYGAAILAAVADGVFDSVEEGSKKLKRVRSVVYPEKNLLEEYKNKYEKYRELYPALKFFFEGEE